MHLKQTPFTHDVWPSIGPHMLCPVSADHIQTFLSSLPETTILLSAEKLRAQMSFRCPLSGPHNGFPLSACQIITVQLRAAVATSRPSGDMETDRIPPMCSEFPCKVTSSTRPTSTVHLEILEPSLANIVLPSSRGIAARNVPVPPEELFQTGSESISKNLIERSSPPSQFLLVLRSFLE